MPDEEAEAVSVELWNVDNSRRQAEHRCKRLRYLEYHSGPSGYGIRRIAQSLPAVNGIRVHKLFAEVLALASEGVDRPVIRACIVRNIQAYKELGHKKAYRDIPLPDMPAEAKFEIDRVIDEQASLLEGLAWGFLKVIVPYLLKTFEVIAIEREFPFTLPAAEGEQRIRIMTKPDLVLRRKVDLALCFWDFKTGGSFSPSWKAQWEDSAQLLTIRKGIEHGLKEPCTFAYILGVLKGRRQEEKATGITRQYSPFCYAWHREANPPMIREDWQINYDYTTEDGKAHRLSKEYKRQAIWAWEFPDKPADWTTLEYWVESLSDEMVQSQFEYLGPYNHDEWVLDSFLRGAVKQENLVREGLWAVYDALQEVPPEEQAWAESNPKILAVLDEHFPQSWDCYKYGKQYKCQMHAICKREIAAENPLERGGFELRRPHHLQELTQMRDRGIEPPPDQEEEDDAE